MTTPTTGRERECAQCGSVYRAARASSVYCSATCRKRAQRGAPPVDNRTADLLRRWLLRRSYAGQIGPTNSRDPRPPVFGLTTPRALALEEWNRWNPGASMTDDAFVAMLSGLTILDMHAQPATAPRSRR
jgi:hypothetical protein